MKEIEETLKMKKKKKSYHQRIILRKGIWNLNVILMQENVKVKVRTKLIKALKNSLNHFL